MQTGRFSHSLKRVIAWLPASMFILAIAAVALFVAQPGFAGAQAASTGAGRPKLTPTASATPGCPPNWNVVNSPNPLTNNYLYAVTAVSPNDVWAVGFYYHYNGGGQGGSLTVHWDGTQWTQVVNPAPLISRLYGVDAVSSNDVWAVGYFQASGNSLPQTLIMHWDGAQWAILPSPNRVGSNELLAVTAISSDDVWAVGDTPGNHGTLTEHWNGSYWAIVPSPPESFGDDFLLTAVDAVSPNDVWAVGYEDRGIGSSRTLIEHWNGTQWSIVPSPNPGAYYGSLYGVAAVAADDVWAVGAYSNDGGSTYPTLMLHWDGTSWNVVPGNSSNSFNSLRGISAVSSTDIWAVGLTTDCSLCLTFNTLIEHWDGTSWSVVPSPNGSNEFNRLRGVAAVSANDVWTVGYSDQYNYPYLSSTLIERHTCAPPPTVTGTPPTATATATQPATASPTACNVSNSNYTISASVGATVVAATTDIGLHCDDCTRTVALPFAWSLYGQSFNSVIAGSNGTLGFAANSNHWNVTCMPSQEFNYAILPYWQDLHLDPAGGGCPGCGIFTSVEGSAPNRIFNIEWRARDYFYTAVVNVEVRLHEDNSNFEIIYGSVPSGSNQQVTVGVQKDLGSRYTQYVCENMAGILTNGTMLTFSLPPCGTPSPGTPLPTSTATATAGSTSTQTAIATGTMTAIVGSTSTWTATAVASSTSTRTATAVATAVASNTPPQATGTATQPATAAPSNTSTAQPATSTPVNTVTPTTCAITFTDVPPGSTFYTFIRCLACRGIVSGYPDGTFRPGAPVTRGQISKVVSNAGGFEEDPGAQIYQDVPPGSPFYPWVNRLSRRGHMGGYPCGIRPEEPCIAPNNMPYFRPSAGATRGQLAKIVANAAEVTGTPTGLFYTDVPGDSPFYVWIMRLTNLGVMGGYQCGGEGEPCDAQNRPYFRPAGAVTRGQAAKITANTFFPNCQAP